MTATRVGAHNGGMTDDRYSFEYPDEAGYPDGSGFLSEDQKTLIDQVADPQADSPGIDFIVQQDDAAGQFTALSGDTQLADLTFKEDGDRVTLVSTTVYPEFRKQGVATELIRRVLDTLRSQGKTVTVVCPIVRTFITSHPEYEDLVDTGRPGLKHSRS